VFQQRRLFTRASSRVVSRKDNCADRLCAARNEKRATAARMCSHMHYAQGWEWESHRGGGRVAVGVRAVPLVYPGDFKHYVNRRRKDRRRDFNHALHLRSIVIYFSGGGGSAGRDRRATMSSFRHPGALVTSRETCAAPECRLSERLFSDPTISRAKRRIRNTCSRSHLQQCGPSGETGLRGRASLCVLH